MDLREQIENKIKKALHPTHLEVINESFMHNVPPGSESHFKIIVVASAFENKNILERQRTINEILSQELKAPPPVPSPMAIGPLVQRTGGGEEKIHALSMQTLTPAEWEAREKKVRETPPCLGGSKK